MVLYSVLDEVEMVLAFGSTSCSEFLKGREDDSFQGDLRDGEFRAQS